MHILPNVLNNEILSRSQVAAAQNVDRPVFIIGYASGSATHDGDLACALDGISHFLSAQPQAQFHCLGDVNLPTWFAREHAAQIKLFKKVDWRELPEFLARFSVQIVPLDDVPFNHSKSQIRYLESSAVGVPVLASRCGEQALTIIDGYTGMLCFNTPKDWQHGLEWFYKHPAESRKMGSCARDYLNKYWTTQSHFRREKWRNILQDCMLGRMRDKISIIVVVYNPLYDVVALCESIQQYTKVPYELLIWVNASDPSTRAYIQGLNIHASYVVDLDVNVGKAFAANYLFRLAHERFVVGMDDDYILPQYWDEKMIASSKSVPNLGWLSTNLTSDSSGIRDLGKSVNYPGGTVLFQPSGVGGWVVFTTASVRERLGFYREHGLYGGIDGDYNRRARAMGLVTGYVRDVVGRHKVQRDKNLAWELFKQRIQDKMRIHGKQSDLVLDKFVDFSRVRSSRLTCAIKISTSVTHDENVWGDTHYAYGLKSALESLDYEVRIDKHECWYKVLERMDVVVHLFGLHEYDPDPESLNIIWIISHVDKIHRAQLLKYDYIFCASTQVAKYVAKLAPEIKCDVLHQCTDSNVFFQDSSVQRDIDVLFVGNSRRIFRDSVRFAIEAGVDLKVWGTKWEQFIPKRHIQAQSIHSRDVAQLYRRARIVLNDHWADQRDFGLVNNRVYDAFACGACVLSDDNFGFDEISLGASIPTFKDIKSFKKQIDNLLFDETMRSKLVHDIGNNVLLNHTFKHRAEKIHNVVRYLILHYVDYKSEKLYQVRKLITEGEVRLN
ncbi:Glycosyl transferases group 1 [anaerobic digester metagenome]